MTAMEYVVIALSIGSGVASGVASGLVVITALKVDVRWLKKSLETAHNRIDRLEDRLKPGSMNHVS